MDSEQSTLSTMQHKEREQIQDILIKEENFIEEFFLEERNPQDDENRGRVDFKIDPSLLNNPCKVLDHDLIPKNVMDNTQGFLMKEDIMQGHLEDVTLNYDEKMEKPQLIMNSPYEAGQQDKAGSSSLSNEVTPHLIDTFQSNSIWFNFDKKYPQMHSGTKIVQQHLRDSSRLCHLIQDSPIKLKKCSVVVQKLIDMSPSNLIKLICDPKPYSRIQSDMKHIPDSFSQYKSTKGLSKLNLKRQNKGRAYKCSSCSYQTPKKDRLREHLYTHSISKPFKCSICPYQAATNRCLKLHTHCHTGVKPYKCTMCPYRASLKQTLSRHLKWHVGEKPFKCSFCPYQTARKDSLDNHSRTHTGEKPFKCSLCSYQAATKDSLKRHSITHTGEKPYKCTLCSYQTAARKSLKIHLRSHTGEKPYECTFCPHKATTRGAIVIHMRTHTGEKPYKCGFCHYQAATKTHIRLHLPIHTGEKPFKCSVCPYQASSKGSLERHALIHCKEVL